VLIFVFEFLVHLDEHAVASTPVSDRAFVIAGTRPDQRLDQPVPFRRPADPTIQDQVEL